MSDEEKKAIENLKGTYWYVGEEGLEENIKIVLNLIEKQSKEIEELKEKNNKLMEELDLTTVYISGVYDGEKKVQDKIKAKIEESEKQQKEEPDAYLCIKVLQSLLEKE